MKQFTLTLLRHGETLAPKHLNGSSNIGLSSVGRQQMFDALSVEDNFDLITTSSLDRCLIFANELANKMQLPISIESLLREIDFGDWDGMAMDALYHQFPQQLDKFWRTPWQFTPPNGEPIETFCKRIDIAWQQLLSQQKNTLVICHSGVIRYIIAKVLGMPIPGNNHLIALNIGYAARVEISVVIDDDGVIWQTLQWPN